MSTADYEVLVDWNDDGDFSDTGEDITERVLRQENIKFVYGRDQARSLSAIRAGETAFTVNNESKDYSPDNASSPLYGNLAPGKPVLIRATFDSTTYNLFRGFLDDYELRPSSKRGVSTVRFTALDLLHKLQQAILSTQMYESLQAGEAINVLLDEIGWPTDDRDIDQGATTLRWWWEEGTDGLTALRKIVDSEGPACFALVDGEGNFVFRDRHHRYKETASTAVQATFRASTTEPLFSEPFSYNIGWKDLINQVIIEVPVRIPQPLAEVWRTETPIIMKAGEVVTLDVKATDPFILAVPPRTTTTQPDVVMRSGTAPTFAITRTSGQVTQIVITASTACIVDKIRLRAQSVKIDHTVKVTAENSDSILKHGVRTDREIQPAWVNPNDAYAIARIITAQRGERLPVVHITVNNANDTRLTQILSRDLSDRIHITETDESGVDDDFFIERIEHEISHVGKLHRVQFGCERVHLDAGVAPNYFTFGKAGSGFNDGVFGEDGLISSGKLFVLGDPGDFGKLDVAGLGF